MQTALVQCKVTNAMIKRFGHQYSGLAGGVSNLILPEFRRNYTFGVPGSTENKVKL